MTDEDSGGEADEPTAARDMCSVCGRGVIGCAARKPGEAARWNDCKECSGGGYPGNQGLWVRVSVLHALLRVACARGRFGGVLVERKGHDVWLVATDGQCLAVYQLDGQLPGNDARWFLPSKWLAAVVKWRSRVNGIKDQVVLSDKVYLETDNVNGPGAGSEAKRRKYADKFPRWQALEPQRCDGVLGPIDVRYLKHVQAIRKAIEDEYNKRGLYVLLRTDGPGSVVRAAFRYPDEHEMPQWLFYVMPIVQVTGD